MTGSTMQFHLTKPCANCPFRSDRIPYLRLARISGILKKLLEGNKTFACHKTLDYEDSQAFQGRTTQHCAGALIFLLNVGKLNNNFLLRLAQSCGLLDISMLQRNAPVYKTKVGLLAAFRRAEKDIGDSHA